VESWQQGVPEFRPRFAEWPQLSDIVAEWGTKMMSGADTRRRDPKDRHAGRRRLKKAGYYDGKKKLAQ
jgi:multiple sugar transport system substrate-binding protein